MNARIIFLRLASPKVGISRSLKSNPANVETITNPKLVVRENPLVSRRITNHLKKTETTKTTVGLGKSNSGITRSQ